MTWLCSFGQQRQEFVLPALRKRENDGIDVGNREDIASGAAVIGRKCGTGASGDKNMGIIANGGVFLIF